MQQSHFRAPSFSLTMFKICSQLKLPLSAASQLFPILQSWHSRSLGQQVEAFPSPVVHLTAPTAAEETSGTQVCVPKTGILTDANGAMKKLLQSQVMHDFFSFSKMAKFSTEQKKKKKPLP